jgi:hypothetical protein
VSVRANDCELEVKCGANVSVFRVSQEGDGVGFGLWPAEPEYDSCAVPEIILSVIVPVGKLSSMIALSRCALH